MEWKVICFLGKFREHADRLFYADFKDGDKLERMVSRWARHRLVKNIVVTAFIAMPQKVEYYISPPLGLLPATGPRKPKTGGRRTSP